MNLNYQSYEPSSYIVSYFRNIADKQPIEIDIVRFLNAIKRGQFFEYILKIRRSLSKSERTKLKQKLPAITSSGTYFNGHNATDLNQLSGLIGIDIDNIPDIEKLRKRINLDSYTFASFASPSGNGLKIIFKVSTNKKTFINSFLAIEIYIRETFNIQIDSACKDFTRLMFISSDSKLYYNLNSKSFDFKHFPIQKPAKIPEYFCYQSNYNLTDKIVLKIEESRIDITAIYSDWLKCAYALVSEFGLGGLYYFHRISQFYPDYNPEATTKQYHQCLKSGSRNITIASLYDLALQFGITYKN